MKNTHLRFTETKLSYHQETQPKQEKLFASFHCSVKGTKAGGTTQAAAETALHCSPPSSFPG